MRINTKKETHPWMIRIKRFGETSGKLQILSKKKNMKILRANFICHGWKEFNVMIIARNCKKE